MASAKMQEMSRLEAISSTLSATIDGDAHAALMREHTTKDDIHAIDLDPSYHSIHKTLRSAYISNGLETDVYTLVKKRGTFEFGVSSAENPYFRHKWTHPLNVHFELYEQGASVGPYRDENGTWLSSFSPIKDAEGKVVAIVQTDRKFDIFESGVQEKTRKNILIQLGVFVVLSLILLFFLKRILDKDEETKEHIVQQAVEIELKNKDLTDSMRAAKRIQEAFMPSQTRIRKVLDSFFNIYLPKDIVSGDFLWFQEIDGKAYMAVGDCTGHGIPGAMMSMVGSSALDFALTQGKRSPAEILDALDLIVQRNFSQKGKSYEAMDIALTCFDLETEELTYASAMRPVVVLSDGKMKKYKGEKRSIGSKKQAGFIDQLIKIKEGDRIYIFSDGYQDQFGGEKGKKYMSKHFEKFIHSIQDHSLEEQQFLFKYEFHHWKRDESQVDDVLVAAFEVPPSERLRIRA